MSRADLIDLILILLALVAGWVFILIYALTDYVQ